MYQHRSNSKTCHLMENVRCGKYAQGNVTNRRILHKTILKVCVLCRSERAPPDFETKKKDRRKERKKNKLGFRGVQSIEGRQSAFLVIFQFCFNKENVILPLKYDFKIQKITESLAYFLPLKYSIRACIFWELGSNSLKPNKIWGLKKKAPMPSRPESRDSSGHLHHRLHGSSIVSSGKGCTWPTLT